MLLLIGFLRVSGNGLYGAMIVLEMEISQLQIESMPSLADYFDIDGSGAGASFVNFELNLLPFSQFIQTTYV